MTQRAAFIETVSRLMDEFPKTILILGDISVFAFRDVFKRHPTRAYNWGTTECASIGAAAGLAANGFYPIYHSIDPFITKRALEFIHIGFGLQQLRGLFITVGGSADYAALGPTHMSPNGPDLMSTVPGMMLLEPSSEEGVRYAIETSVRERRLAYVRLEEKR